MSSAAVHANNSPRSNDVLSSPQSSCSSLLNFSKAQTSASSSHPKESIVKVPYPILSDHRDPTSVLSLLQKETQTTSKKIVDVVRLIDSCEKKLSSNPLSEDERKLHKHERVQRKQQLDALKKHERRVNLQIDYITTRTEIKGLEEKRKLVREHDDSAEDKQIEILLKKLKQKLDQMKIYMRKRNEEMKKLVDEKQEASTSTGARRQSTSNQNPQQRSSQSDSNRKRSLPLVSNSHSDKYFKPMSSKPPVIHLASRSSAQQIKSQPIQTPTVRFLKKTTESTTTSSTSPASSSSTLSPPLIATTSMDDTNHTSASLQRDVLHSPAEDGEVDLEFDVDDLFNDDLPSEESIKRLSFDSLGYVRETAS